MHNFQLDWLANWAKYTPNRMFLHEHQRDVQWNYSDFNLRANALADYLLNQYKIKKDDRIAIYSKNKSEHVILFLACIKLGALLVPLNFRLMPRELNILINDADPKLFFYDEEFKDHIPKLSSIDKIEFVNTLDEITKFLFENNIKSDFVSSQILTEDDAVMILYTAGTTGLSKGVIITHKMLFWNSINTGLRLDLHSSDHTQSFAPFFHTGGWNVLFTPFLHHGASHTLLTQFDADLILQLMEKEKATILFGVPTMLQMMADSPYFSKVDLSSVRYAIVGGAPMPIPLINTWHNKGVFIRQGYGLTEVGPNCFSLHQDDAIRKKGSIGFPNFYIETKIVKEDKTECASNEVGELWLKSPVITPGYWKNDKATKESITDGWFHTGDLVKQDEDGYFYVVDRKKNMYISGGENVFPAEVETYLYTNEKVKEAAVIGVDDEKWGEVGKAYIVLKDDQLSNEKEIIDYCKGNLAKYKIPKYVEFLSELPKTEAGKIDKKKLIQMHKDSLNNRS
ncbi:MAG: AMP-binding protein [Ignavibacteriaceae bacterium]|nr:AMP-binding protein [Ignavibacterium sp.]MCC6255281.1 AMP-binding protein [Ignavibacteriaceae bacterium]HRP92615.1 AMP-binding protein [Ignavibacteriaceae bacterium]HRQ53153.1 AMP-binding protein [Ignavibacteriaceae bacterium]